VDEPLSSRHTSSTNPDCRTFFEIRERRRSCPCRDGPSAVDSPLTTLRLARCPRCQALFAICRRCDRGHVYCSPRCSVEARSESLRQARRRHRQSPEGRLDHRDRERARRRRRRIGAPRVGDHPSTPASASVSVEPSRVAAGSAVPSHPCSADPDPPEARLYALSSSPLPRYAHRLLRCARCHAQATHFARSRVERGARARPW
jgi:hypothetical protein